ncbi:MAG: hypothetical protein JKY88_19260 [Pseudomonadales bacterium]|nr:hypothetical protein [Pseudomonadales bacterium]
MEDLTIDEMREVSGGLGLESGGLAIIAIGLATAATAGFGLAIGGALLYVSYRMR